MRLCEENCTKSKKIIRGCIFLAYFFIMLLLFRIEDFIGTAISSQETFDVRYETEDTLSNNQKIYRLYKNGEYYMDVDYNEFSLLDDEGTMNYKYCALILEAKSLCYSILLSIMLVMGVLVAYSTTKGTPFTKENVKRIRIIGILQLLLAIVPGMLAFVMKFIKFTYISTTLTLHDFYMILIAFIIMMIAQIFDYGVKLQEDSDSIA